MKEETTRYKKVAKAAAVAEEQPLVVEHCARRIAIYRSEDKYFALEDICPHMGAFLSHGYREEEKIVCPWHNWQFDLATGKCLSNDSGASVQCFSIQEVGDDLWLPDEPCEDYLED